MSNPTELPCLDACPFCGNDEVHVQDSYLHGQGFMVMCGNCTGEGPLCPTEQNAAEQWNRRAQPEGEAPQAEPAQYVISVQDSFEMLEKERPGRRMKVQSREPNLGWTEDRVQALAEKLADASAKNAGVARQLTFPHIYLGLKDALLASMPRWLSTADSMPSEDGALLVVFDPSNSPTIWPAVWNKEHACFDSHGGWFERSEVTHWMPLPDAPAATLSPLCGAQHAVSGKEVAPQGYAIVPLIPTGAMNKAAVLYLNGPDIYSAGLAPTVLEIEESIYHEVYRAMIAAAPVVAPNCGACPGDGSVCATHCKLANESPRAAQLDGGQEGSESNG